MKNWMSEDGKVHWIRSWPAEESSGIKKENINQGEIQYIACGVFMQKRVLTDWQK